MKYYILSALLFLAVLWQTADAQENRRLLRITESGKGRVNPMIDNIGYWSRMAKLGYVEADTVSFFPPPRFSGVAVKASDLPPQDSPDVPVTGESDVTQSENSVFIDPYNEFHVLNSNNSSSWDGGFAGIPYGANAVWSLDEGMTWQGFTNGVNGSNGGDPAVAIGLNGWWYVCRITGDNGQAVSYSKNQGQSWTRVKVGEGPAAGYGLLDKNHLWIDNAPESPFEGHLYAGWTNFIPGSPDTNQVQMVRSDNGGLNWSAPVTVSFGVNAMKLNHGVNIHTGPDGEVYAAWSIYDTWPSDETAIGFCRSSDGGNSWSTAQRIIGNLKGIRASLTSKNMRVHAFPSMAVDISPGPGRGTLYMVFPNVGFPGVNTGTDIDIYLIKSTDQGNTWSVPIRVNQDPAGLGKQHYFPWITCDPVTGGLCVIYYDDRNLAPSDVATFVSYSYDGGTTWSDFQVSDHSFTPSPVPGLAFSYFGDYIGIQSRNMKVYPVWTDNHQGGRAMSYASPFNLGPNPGQPWVMYHAHQISSISSGAPSVIKYGDSLHLSLELKNTGDQTAQNLTATISSGSPYILISDTLEYYDTIGPGMTRTLPAGYAFKVSDTIPDNLLIRFDILASSPDSSAWQWKSHFSVEAQAPDVRILNLTILDTIQGNRDGRLDPGEEAILRVTCKNTGDFATALTTAMLSSTSPFLVITPPWVQWNSVVPNETREAEFRVVVASETPIGTGIDLKAEVTFGNYSRKRPYRLIVGMVVEDWETNTFNKFPWQSAGAKPWQLSAFEPWEGNYCLQAGLIGDYQNTQFMLDYTSSLDDSISFYLKTSSEQDYDYLMFAIDGVLQGQWSGKTPWTRVAFPVSAGSHNYKWIYLKDVSFTAGLDRCWVDFIALPPPVLPEVDPGPDDTICAGFNAGLTAAVSGADSVRWTSGGDGVFENDTALVTSYIPGSADLLAESVILRLTGFGTYGSTAVEKELTIRPLPDATIHSDPRDTVCAGHQITLSVPPLNGGSYLWMPGNFSSSSAVYDTTILGGQGEFSVGIEVTDSMGCRRSDSVILLFKDCTGVAESLQNSFSVVPNPGKGLFQVETSGVFHEKITVTVMNLTANVLYRRFMEFPEPASGFGIDLSFLPAGSYILTLLYKEGKTDIKLIISK